MPKFHYRYVAWLFLLSIRGELSPNFTFWDEPTRDWSTYWKVVSQNIREIGEGEPLKKTMQSCLCTAQVRCDIVSFGMISVHYVQQDKQKLVHACRLATSVVRCVYAFRNYLFEFLRQFSTPLSAVWRHTTLQPAFWNLLGFERRRVIHQKTFQEKLYHISHTYFLVRVPL